MTYHGFSVVVRSSLVVSPDGCFDAEEKGGRCRRRSDRSIGVSVTTTGVLKSIVPIVRLHLRKVKRSLATVCASTSEEEDYSGKFSIPQSSEFYYYFIYFCIYISFEVLDFVYAFFVFSRSRTN